MSDRIIVYPQEVPFDTDFLKIERFGIEGQGRLLDAILGDTTQLNRLECTETVVPSMAVLVGTGEIYIQEEVDPNDYGSLAPDTTLIVKQGILATPQTLATPAPLVVGDSINYLIQFGFIESDINVESRPFYNSSDPTVPNFNNVSGTRNDACVVSVKAGTPATTGTQTTPAPDAGYIGGYVVTVAYGQTTVTTGDISVDTNAPFITGKLKDKLDEAEADARYVPQSSFAQTASSNGYLELFGGLIIQWGNSTLPAVPAGTSNIAITFPIPFPTNTFSITTSYKDTVIQNSPAWNAMTTAWKNKTLSGFDFFGDAQAHSFDNPVDVSWIAIGN